MARDAELRPIHVDLPRDMYELIRRAAEIEGETLEEFLVRATEMRLRGEWPTR
jgi:uncharacterized protein (DUF1778 family)